MALQKGETLHGFTVLDMVELEELKAKGIWARHKSGAEVFQVLNEDSENLFAFCFATTPEDSSGEAHILEHSVLCGSKKYPLKDAFLALAQGSMQTYLNAWTFPDKTVYPSSSVNEKDYFNLMAVYGDAVFHPLLSEWTFMQEGVRLSFTEQNRLEYTGVVYNEMKGSYSSMDTYAGHWSVKAVMPDTPYALESGGDPEDIPALTWEKLKDFHRTRYAPANCKIFLAGNIPPEKQFAFLNETCLAGLEPGKAADPVNKAVRWNEGRKVRVPCPAGGEQKPQVFLSWLCGDAAKAGETTALSCLVEILMGHDGSPLTRALIESGLGEDLAPCSGIEGELRETSVSAGLRGVNGDVRETAGKIESLILEELGRLSRDGLPREEIDAALLSIEFSHREIRRSGGPFSLVWLRRSLRGWLHGAKPWESLLFVPNFSALKTKLAENPRFFESLIDDYLLNNPHRALITIEPEADYLEKKEAELAERLSQKEKHLSKEERKAIRDKSQELEQRQSQSETPEVLASIPHLSRKDLIPKIDTVSGEWKTGALSVLVHPVFTNGISYCDLAFPLDILPPEDYPWLPFFSRAIVSMGLPGMDYGEVSGLLARTVGDFHALLETGSPAPDASASVNPPGIAPGRDWIIYRLKALDEKLGASLDIARRLITEADFSDHRRLRDLILEMKNDADSSLAPGGHNYAAGRSGRNVSRARAVDELWNGLYSIDYTHYMAELDTAELARRLVSIRDRLAAAGLTAHLTGLHGAALDEMEQRFGAFGPPGQANPATAGKEVFLASINPAGNPADGTSAAAEVFSSPSLQIGFAAMTLPAAPYNSREQAAEWVLAHELSTGALWESIRMMGGAYGASAHSDNLEGVFSLCTYRDPDPFRSLSAFPEILKKRGSAAIDEDNLEKSIIGTFARETRPRTPAEKGAHAFFRSLYGVSEGHRLKRLEDIVSLTVEETSSRARALAEAADLQSRPVVIAGITAAEKAAAALGVQVQKLPI